MHGGIFQCCSSFIQLSPLYPTKGHRVGGGGLGLTVRDKGLFSDIKNTALKVSLNHSVLNSS